MLGGDYSGLAPGFRALEYLECAGARCSQSLSQPNVSCVTEVRRATFLESRCRRNFPSARRCENAIPGGVVKVNKLIAVLLGFFVLLMMTGTALAQTAPKTPTVLKGAPIGAVKFDHTSHLKVAPKCETCH